MRLTADTFLNNRNLVKMFHENDEELSKMIEKAIGTNRVVERFDYYSSVSCDRSIYKLDYVVPFPDNNKLNTRHLTDIPAHSVGNEFTRLKTRVSNVVSLPIHRLVLNGGSVFSDRMYSKSGPFEIEYEVDHTSGDTVWTLMFDYRPDGKANISKRVISDVGPGVIREFLGVGFVQIEVETGAFGNGSYLDGVFMMPTRDENKFYPRSVKGRLSGSFSSDTLFREASWVAPLDDVLQKSYYNATFDDKNPGCAAGAGCLCRREFLEKEKDPRLWRTIKYCRGDHCFEDASGRIFEPCVVDPVFSEAFFNKVYDHLSHFAEFASTTIKSQKMLLYTLEIDTFVYSEKLSPRMRGCLALAVSCVSKNLTFSDEIHAALAGLRREFHSNVAFPKVIRFIQSSFLPDEAKLKELCLTERARDIVFVFDEAFDRYRQFTQLEENRRVDWLDHLGGTDFSIKHRLMCTNLVASQPPRMWFHSTCMTEKDGKCVMCKAPLQITTLDENFRFTTRWLGMRPPEFGPKIGELSIIAGWKNFDLYRTLPLKCGSELFDRSKLLVRVGDEYFIDDKSKQKYIVECLTIAPGTGKIENGVDKLFTDRWDSSFERKYFEELEKELQSCRKKILVMQLSHTQQQESVSSDEMKKAEMDNDELFSDNRLRYQELKNMRQQLDHSGRLYSEAEKKYQKKLADKKKELDTKEKEITDLNCRIKLVEEALKKKLHEMIKSRHHVSRRLTELQKKYEELQVFHQRFLDNWEREARKKLGKDSG